MRSIALFPLLTLLYLLLSSHEFWLQPDKFIYQRGDDITIRFYVGENFKGENWKGNNSKVSSLKLYYSGVSDNLAPQVSVQEGDSIQFRIYDEGNALIAYNSTNSFIELPAAEFNNYLEEDGLSEALAYRQAEGETDRAGREWYQRCSKTLLQIGGINNSSYRTPTQLPLDIIPLQNPYTIKENDSLKIKILFRKAPLANTKVHIWNRKDGSTQKTAMMTDDKGELAFPVTLNGAWMVSTVKMIHLQDDPQADWQSFWGSFTWGYE
ncbi:MAG: DUF4198 domain-containing protein [Terrimonas sp.]|nr:DUF4198 domain-containing protein [Terrimonas sp.]